jgi:hypothetical protein
MVTQCGPRQYTSQIEGPHLSAIYRLLLLRIIWRTKEERKVLDFLYRLSNLLVKVTFRVSMNVVTKALKFTQPLEPFSVFKEGLLYLAWEGE